MRPPSSSLPPRRPGGGMNASGTDLVAPGAAHYLTGSDRSGEWPLAPEFFGEALDAAMALVHADSGELATLDDSRQRLVLRARRTRPRLEPGMSGFGSMGPLGAPGRTSQPLGGHESAAAIEQPRTYRPGERLIGYTWQRGEPVIMRGEDCRALPGGTAPADTDAPWHLAVPIHRPGSFIHPPANRPIVGIIAVHNRDPLWSFSPRDVELLMLHADRVACSMKADEMAHLNEGQAALLEILRGEGGSLPDLPSLYLRVRDVVRQMIDAPSFALVTYQSRTDELSYALAERDGQVISVAPISAAAAPRWWSAARSGRVVCVSAPEDRAAHPEFCVLGWGGEEPVQSLLAAPLIVGKALLGAIVAGSRRSDAYAPESSRLFETVGRSAAVVIEAAGLADRTRRSLQQARAKAEQLSVLNNAVLTLNASLDLDTTLNALVRQAKGLTSAQVCRVFLLDEAGESLVVPSASPDRRGDAGAPSTRAASAAPPEDVRIPLTWRNLGMLLAREQYLVLTDLDAEWHEPTAPGRLLDAERVHEALILPVAAQQGTLLGALWVYTPGQRYHFAAEEIGLLEGLAGQAALAISNARLYQQLERAYEQQKELDRYKDEFILTVSHEFRTPLTAIDGYVTLISRHGERLEPQKLEQFAQEIRLATSQLASMISMLADANRMSSQPLTLTLRPVNVQACAETALKQQSPESKSRVDSTIPAELWVPGDPERLTLVLSNLLSNALKYSPATERCALSARLERRETLARAGLKCAVAEDAPDRWVVVTVTDRGEGIGPEDRKLLFKKFVRLSRSLTTPVRGTGLGLWICKRYIKAMGGDIWVESALGDGSSFSFALPVTTAPPEAS